MMDKKYGNLITVLSAAVVSMFLCVSCVSYKAVPTGREKPAHNIICNLQTGTLGGLQINAAVSRSQIADTLGGPSEYELVEADDWFFFYDTCFFSYLDNGISLITEIRGSRGYVTDISIYTKSMVAIDDFFYYQYPGGFEPSVSGNDTVESIRDKFGTPDDFAEYIDDDIVRSTSMEYERPYGSLNFWFDEDGRLGRIDLYDQN